VRSAVEPGTGKATRQTSINAEGYGERFVKRRGLFCIGVVASRHFSQVA
jgi:hypothetical protein